MRSLPPVPPQRRGVFTLAEALAAGWTFDELRHAFRTGALVRLRRGCFATPVPEGLAVFEARDLDLLRRTVAATLVSRDMRASHLGSAMLLDLPTWAPAPRVCTTTTRDCALRGVHVHHALPRPGHFGVVGGLRVTGPERTGVDLAREFGVESALVTLDAGVRSGVVDPVILRGMVDLMGEDLDVAAARSALDLLDPSAESPLESRSRWHLLQHQIPAPLTQVEILTPAGEFIGRTDFYWPDGVVGEVDGTSKYDTPDVLGREKWRQERLEGLGLQVVRWGAQHLGDFGPTAARLRRALARAQRGDRDRLWIAVPPSSP